MRHTLCSGTWESATAWGLLLIQVHTCMGVWVHALASNCTWHGDQKSSGWKTTTRLKPQCWLRALINHSPPKPLVYLFRDSLGWLVEFTAKFLQFQPELQLLSIADVSNSETMSTNSILHFCRTNTWGCYGISCLPSTSCCGDVWGISPRTVEHPPQIWKHYNMLMIHHIQWRMRIHHIQWSLRIHHI